MFTTAKHPTYPQQGKVTLTMIVSLYSQFTLRSEYDMAALCEKLNELYTPIGEHTITRGFYCRHCAQVVMKDAEFDIPFDDMLKTMRKIQDEVLSAFDMERIDIEIQDDRGCGVELFY